MIDLTPIVNAVIVVLSALITAVLVPWIRRKTTETQRNELATWVQIAVNAAEQMIQGTKLGRERKEWVLSYLQERGYDLDDAETAAQINAMIEAFVLGLKQNANT